MSEAHYCEPPRYPASPDETWACECGSLYAAFDPATDPFISEWVKPHISSGRLGWARVFTTTAFL